MLSKSGEATQPAVPAEPSGRGRRAFRMAAIAVGSGWLAVIILVVVGLTIPSAPSRTVAGTPAHRPAVTVTRPAVQPTAHPAVHPTAHPAIQPRVGPSVRPSVHRVVQVTPRPPRLSGHQVSETSKEFARTPIACRPAQKCANRGCNQSVAVPAATASFNSVQAAFDGRGMALSGDPFSGNFDCGGFSYQAQQLAADGFGPGDRVAVAGKVLTLPPVAPGAPDEIVAMGQMIRLSPPAQPAAELGFLGAGEFGTQSGTVTITYAGGSTQKATIRLADWYSDVAAPGTVIAASGLWDVPSNQRSSFGPAPVSVYYAQVPLDPAKRVASVTLPKDPNLHLFDLGVPSAAAYPTVSSAFNDTSLVMPGAAGDGNYDGAGHSYNAAALAAKGLHAGASVTANGVKFSWPDYGPDHFDNIRAQGQTIGVAGTGPMLGFLGAATLGTQRGTITIQYSDGSTQTAVLSFADWRANRAAIGGTIIATVPWNQIPGAHSRLVSIYSAKVPLEKGKTVVSVTLPVNIDMHVLAIAEGN
jgi:hypothetical protein